jgi:hypothetical protein
VLPSIASDKEKADPEKRGGREVTEEDGGLNKVYWEGVVASQNINLVMLL